MDAEIDISPCSTLDCPPPDPDVIDLDRLADSLHHLALYSGKPAPDESGQDAAGEAVAEDQPLVVDPVPIAGEQFLRRPSGAAFSPGEMHHAGCIESSRTLSQTS